MQRRSVPPGARGRRLADMPMVSIVVASTGPRERLERALGAMVPAAQARGVELVVCRPCSVEEYRSLEAAFPSVLFMPAPDNASHAQVRGIGLSATEGDVVAVLDDDGTLDADWLERLTTPRTDQTPHEGPRVDWVAWFAGKNVVLP